MTLHPGEDKAWEILESLDCMDICRLAQVSYDPGSRTYTVRSFGMDFQVSLSNKTISSASPGSEVLGTNSVISSGSWCIDLLQIPDTTVDTPCAL